MNKTTWYKGYSIQFEPREVLQYSVCFDKHECDYGDYSTLALAKRAIDRFLKACGE